MARTKTARTNGKRANDLSHEDVGNVLSLEHVNVTIPDQGLATLFYIVGMGFTRDPYMTVGVNNMWSNLGEQQFHTPTREPQRIPGHMGIVVPSLDGLVARLDSVKELLADTQFGYERKDGYVAVTCPWGNQFRCYEPHPRFGDMRLGMPYVEFLVPTGKAEGIARFYEKVLGTPASVLRDKQGTAANVRIGKSQWLSFRETKEPIPPYDGHHIAVYVANFSGPYNALNEHGLIMEDVRNHQFRFKTIADPETWEPLFTLEHEVRGLHHAMHNRFMVNRNPDQSQMSYTRGHDAFVPVGV